MRASKRQRASQTRTARGGSRRGFTLVEVLIALALFAMGASALMGLYLKNLHSAKLARTEIILALIQKDVASKNQLAAFQSDLPAPRYTFAQDFAKPEPDQNFNRDQWLVGHDGSDSSGNIPDPDIVNPEESIDHYNRLVAPYDSAPPPGKTINELLAITSIKHPLFNGLDDEIEAQWHRLWEHIIMYRGFTYILRKFESTDADNKENNQFVDWDGYGWLIEEEYGVSFNDDNDDGKIDGDDDTDDRWNLGKPSPSHGVAFDPKGLRYYYKRLKIIVGWDLANGKKFDAREFPDPRSGKYDVFYFSVYNPDLHKH